MNIPIDELIDDRVIERPRIACKNTDLVKAFCFFYDSGDHEAADRMLTASLRIPFSRLLIYADFQDDDFSMTEFVEKLIEAHSEEAA